jgi:hypothetical protein
VFEVEFSLSCLARFEPRPNPRSDEEEAELEAFVEAFIFEGRLSLTFFEASELND